MTTYSEVTAKVHNIRIRSNKARFGLAGFNGTVADCNVVNAGVRSCSLA